MTYIITPYSYHQAKKLDVIIVPSHKKNKKIDVYSIGDKKYITSIGDTHYLDYPQYIETKGIDYANKRRYLYHKRHSKYSNKIGSASYYASKILW